MATKSFKSKYSFKSDERPEKVKTPVKITVDESDLEPFEYAGSKREITKFNSAELKFENDVSSRYEDIGNIFSHDEEVIRVPPILIRIGCLERPTIHMDLPR
jgi:hypothetical protein